MTTLSKSDFQLALSCPKKLVYKKANYPTTNDTNEYMEMLAKGGYIIGEMAKLYYPDGIEIEGNQQESLEMTNKHLKQDAVVLFEPVIVSGQKIVRVDILVKNGRKLHIIEVKSASYDSTIKDPYKALSKYINDAAYQYAVLSEAFPDYEITCSLFMPDKSRRTNIGALAGWFYIEKSNTTSPENEDIITQQKAKFQKPKVTFKYADHPEKSTYIDQILNHGFLNWLDVTQNVIDLLPSITQKSNTFLRILNEGITSNDYSINKNCKSCEFRTPDADLNGFGECWHGLPAVKDHIFDLYFGGVVTNELNEFHINELIWSKKTSLFDFDIEMLKDRNGNYGTRALRQIQQIDNTRNNQEWISDELNSVVDSFQYPLHFVDFETYTGAVPFHIGMRPYELIAFQWSCHTIRHKGATPEHKEWIHTGKMFPDSEVFPNFEFAKSLMFHLGDEGTPFMWATHENTVLRNILEQMDDFKIDDEALRQWLTSMTTDKKSNRNGRWIDMNKMTLEHYFHPTMKGKTSIKKVLPAIWTNYPYLHEVQHFRDYAPENLDESFIDPYDTLSAGIDFDEMDDEVVKSGTKAMRAYYRIRFDRSLSESERSEIRRQLLEYCKLDTMAMVIIAYHWGLK